MNVKISPNRPHGYVACALRHPGEIQAQLECVFSCYFFSFGNRSDRPVPCLIKDVTLDTYVVPKILRHALRLASKLPTKVKVESPPTQDACIWRLP